MVKTEVRAQLLNEFCGHAQPYPTNRTILQLFEEQAARVPESPAVTFGDATLSYQALDRRANALADTLRARGVGRGDFVPLVVRNGLDLPVSVIALMKLGAPFVPIDDLWPANRLTGMIETLRPKVVLYGAEARADAVPEGLRLTVDAAALPERPQADFGAPAGMTDLIYGFYTSGSTGAPKCTLNIHRGLLNRFLYMTRRFGGHADEVVMQNSRHVFDSSIWQLLWPLTNGARVVVPRRDGVLDLSATIDTVWRYGVTMTDFVPSIFNTLVELAAAEPELVPRLASLRTILIGGEEINTRAVQHFRAMLPGVRIVNTYGPTECSIGSVFHTVTDSDRESIPVGRPIDNTYVVVLDEDGELVPPGTVGEIHIGGDCLGLGYLNDPERTANAFVDNPFPEIPGAKLYRTGDHGSWRTDGNLVFEGRSDQQIKIGGVRVELSEIELVLQAHPGVREAKVIVHDELGNRSLIAYLTCDNAVTDALVREHARGALPPYLLPKRFVLLDRMPLTPNGKTDRLALAAMAGTPDAAVADLHGVEREVQELWHRQVPGVRIGADDNFFRIGGDSLTAQKLALALNARFGTRFTVRDLVHCPTIAGQAARIRGEREVVSTFEEMAQDAMLPADIRPAAPTTAPGSPRNVLLTGATGFVGGQLLHDLLRGTDAVVHCLVRAEDRAAAQARIMANLRAYRLWAPELAHRVVAVPGDLGAPRLGLAESEYQRLAAVVDTVLHNGAMVNLVREYAAHRAANVSGTTEILRLASTGHTKPVHFVSTLTVLPDGGVEAPAPATSRPDDGYSQSKLVGEWLMDAAAERGLPVAVYRLGEVMPHTRHGVPSRDGLIDLLVRACVRAGVTFRSEVALDYLPVDHASELVLAAVNGGETGYFHLRQQEPTRLDDVLDAFRKVFDLADVSYPDFLDRVRSAAEDDRDVARVLTMLPASEPDLPMLFSELSSRCPAERAERVARHNGLAPVPVGTDVFHSYALGAKRSVPASQPGDGITVWLTGLPSSGKSTIARGVANLLRDAGRRVAVLDGDEIRRNLTSDLGFSRADREENVRRIGFVASMLSMHGVITLVPVIAPYTADRERVRAQHLNSDIDFAEVYVAAPVLACSKRDVKGLYAKQRAGELRGLTGVDDPYEPPTEADVVLPTHTQTIDESVNAVYSLVMDRVRP
ncbi:adenylyl-sulfate kinase [Amycolatopsis aidingensis]|uniref:adenylyl-sulfate kinase n=1 Tax=Amycolatopsis aidingensis TaxID=2842453 RepID=UPI001C0B396E|nr:adenylyl-sulfate kinase [Amycolatopsis aidingensis]